MLFGSLLVLEVAERRGFYVRAITMHDSEGDAYRKSDCLYGYGVFG